MSIFFAHVARSSGSATDARRTRVVLCLREVERSGALLTRFWTQLPNILARCQWGFLPTGVPLGSIHRMVLQCGDHTAMEVAIRHFKLIRTMLDHVRYKPARIIFARGVISSEVS